MGPQLDKQVCFALYSTSSTVTQAYRKLLAPLNLTYPQFVVMMALWQEDKVSATALSNTIGLSKATLTPLLKRLEITGYITKDLAEGDDRQKCIQLTEQGMSLAKPADTASKQALCATGLTKKEAEQLLTLCNKIKTELKLKL